MGGLRFSLRRLGSRHRSARVGVGVACRGRSASGLRSRWRQVRRGSASRNRHRTRRRALDTCARIRGGVVRRTGSDARSHGDDRHRRRVEGVAHAPRDAARSEGRERGRGRPDRRSRANRRRRTCGSVRPSRHSGRRGRLRRPTRLASVAECLPPSAGTRDAARPSPFGCCVARASTGRRAAGAESRCFGAVCTCLRGAGSRRTARAGRCGVGGRGRGRFRNGVESACSSGRRPSGLNDGDTDAAGHQNARRYEGADATSRVARWNRHA